MKVFDIKLERNEYAAGETAKGILVISSNGFKVKHFKFYAYGEEITQHTGLAVDIANMASRMNVGAWGPGGETKTNREKSDTFFSKDLLPFLTSASMARIKSDSEGVRLGLLLRHWNLDINSDQRMNTNGENIVDLVENLLICSCKTFRH